jgi:hypothetical protein
MKTLIAGAGAGAGVIGTVYGAHIAAAGSRRGELFSQGSPILGLQCPGRALPRITKNPGPVPSRDFHAGAAARSPEQHFDITTLPGFPSFANFRIRCGSILPYR